MLVSLPCEAAMKTVLMKSKVTVNPNPFTSALVINIHGLFSMNIVIRLINSNGTVIRTIGYTVEKGDNKVIIDKLERYVVGAYYLEIKLLTGDLLNTIKLVKK